jgi:hypothetical protein
MQPSPLANPLATISQLETSGSRLDGIPADLEDSVRFAGARLTQAAGILLRLPQEVIAQAIVVFMRFWLGPDGGSLVEFGAEVHSPTQQCAYQTDKYSASLRVLPVFYYETLRIPKITTEYRQRIRVPRVLPVHLYRSR